jgi:hypothetical protein
MEIELSVASNLSDYTAIDGLNREMLDTLEDYLLNLQSLELTKTGSTKA